MNRRLILAAYPQGLPGPEHFRLDIQPVPEVADGQVLLRTRYLSIDPYMRNLMAPAGPGYAPPVPLGGVMVGGTVSEVVASRHAGFKPGELVLGNAGWQDYALSDGNDLLALGHLARPSLALGGLGMPGFTAYVGLLDIGRPQPGETVVVAAATGAVGSVVGQLAKLTGARVVGIAGGADKCRHAVETLGFDACIDRHAPDLGARLAAACPGGIDVYFENVGGDVLAAVLPLLNLHARVPVCGFISHYNDAAPAPGPDLATLLAKRIKLQGFIILDHYGERFDAFRRDMQGWLAEGRITLREDVMDGLEQAPAVLARLLQGGNFGKAVVKVS
jgi:NADPH-dependent curcumin reductase